MKDNIHLKQAPALGEHLRDQAEIERKGLRLELLKLAMIGTGIGFFFSLTATLYLATTSCCSTPPELIVANTVLGSILTTIIGVIAGSSID